jgi:hypothetical protein
MILRFFADLYRSIFTPILMLHKVVVITRTLLLVSVAIGSFSAFSAFSDTAKYIYLDNEVQELVLTKKTTRQSSQTNPAITATFYNAYLKSFPESKGRLMLNGHQWQGILLHNGKIHLISDLSDDPHLTSSEQRFATRALNDGNVLGQCGVTATTDKPVSAPITTRSLATKHTTINYGQFCRDQVDGVCLVAELTVVFDSHFEAAFGAADYQNQATTILEFVDLIYRENFNIAFNQLNLVYGEDITASTDINEVIEEVYQRRVNPTPAAYDTNSQSLLHFISGRTFTSDSGAIGIAYFPSYSSYPSRVTPYLCTPFATGTSQVYGSGSSRAALTSLIVAHEIGHNFGFDHDGESGSFAERCHQSQFIMGATLNPNAQSFSTCSEEALAPNINAVSHIESCFDFPVNAAISASSETRTTIPSLDEFTNQYSVLLDNVSGFGSDIEISGSIDASAATFSHASLGGNTCTLSNANQRYDCSLTDALGTSTLSLTISPAITDIELSHNVTAIASADRYEVNLDDNSYLDTILLPQPGLAPQNLSASRSGNTIFLNWQDRASDEVQFTVERKTDADTWEVIVENLAPNTESFSSIGPSSLQYRFRVNAVFSDNSLSTSNEVAVDGVEPQSRSIIAASGSSGSLNWFGLIPLILLLARQKTKPVTPRTKRPNK